MCSTHYTATCTTCQATPTSAAPRICTSGWSPPSLGSASIVSRRPTTRVSSTSPASTLKGNALPAGCLSQYGAGFQASLKKVSFSEEKSFRILYSSSLYQVHITGAFQAWTFHCCSFLSIRRRTRHVGGGHYFNNQMFFSFSLIRVFVLFMMRCFFPLQ